jgi:hypothetical protein
MFPEARHKLGILIVHHKLWHLMMLDPHIKEFFSKLKVVAIVLVGVIFANLENQSTT